MRLFLLFISFIVGYFTQTEILLAQEKAGVSATAPDDRRMALMPDKGSGSSSSDFLSYFFQPQYNQMVRQAVVGWPQPINFLQMRAMYARTRQYDPLGQETLQKMAEMSYAIEHEKNAEVRTRKQEEFQALALDHLGNVDVVLQALSLARQDSGYGNPDFYEWAVKGIEKAVLDSHKGRTMGDAYILISMGEETLIFSRLGAKSTYAKLVSDGTRFYYIHLAEDLKTHEKFELYMDATIPMRILKGRYNSSGGAKPLNLRSK